MQRKMAVRVQQGGKTRTFTRRRSVRPPRARRLRTRLKEAGLSLLFFLCGLLMASLYGLAMVAMGGPTLRFAVRATLVLAALLGFGMGVSVWARVCVLLALPALCSAQGRNLLLLLFGSVLLSGPLSNVLLNAERAAASLLCGAQLLANQTQELTERAATPLFSVMENVRAMSENAHAVAERVHEAVGAMADSAEHVVGSLRNVLHFLVDVAERCNEQMGAPYRKCQQLFHEAHGDCTQLLADFGFLCDVIGGFLPLCQLARAGELFCVVPAFVADIYKHLDDPTAAAFRRLAGEFAFNLSATVDVTVAMNSSRSLEEAARAVLDELNVQAFDWLQSPLGYVGMALLGVAFLRAVRYRRLYLTNLAFDNVYVDAGWAELNAVLPLTRREARTYIAARRSAVAAGTCWA